MMRVSFPKTFHHAYFTGNKIQRITTVEFTITESTSLKPLKINGIVTITRVIRNKYISIKLRFYSY